MLLKDRAVIITGAGRGIGKAAAHKFAAEGAWVAVVSRTKSQLDEVVQVIRGRGGKALAVEADITQEARVKEMVQRVLDAFGKIDVLVNNAALPGPQKPLVEIEMKDWDIPHNINLRGTAMCAKYVLPHMMAKRSGCIINVSSSAGRRGMAGRTHYSSSKFGVIGFTQALAMEAGPHNVRVNCIVPGAINTELLVAYHHRMAKERGVSYEKIKAEAAAAAPLNKVVEPDEVADLMVYLASDLSSGIHGQSIDINVGSWMT
jgi:NAD(P)-dependent dehydrogenase (short-subunit alcohol dehydrogenase family)